MWFGDFIAPAPQAERIVFRYFIEASTLNFLFKYFERCVNALLFSSINWGLNQLVVSGPKEASERMGEGALLSFRGVAK